MNGSQQIQFREALQYGNSIRLIQDQIQFVANALRRKVINKEAPIGDQSQRILRHLESITPLITDSAIHARGIINERTRVQHANQPPLQVFLTRSEERRV